MKNIVKYALAAAASVVALASCDLNLLPSTSIAYDENGVLFAYSTDVDAFEAGILASYRSIQGGDNALAEDVQLDYFNAHADYGNNYGSLHKCDYNFTAGDYDVQDFWSGNYSAIKNYNIVIENADKVEDESLVEDVTRLKGEALFFRASSYINLARHFAKDYNASTAVDDLCVPLILKYDQNERPARATVQQVYDQVLKDLDAAAKILEKVPGKVRSQVPTIDAVYALYARYYLDTDQPAKAAEYATKVIKSNAGYALCASDEDFVAEYINDEGNEPVMQMYASLAELPNAISAYTALSAGSDIPEGYYFIPYFLPTQDLLDSYDEGDLRLKYWYGNEIGDYVPTLAGKTIPVKNGGNYVYDAIVLKKHLGNPALVSSGIPNGRNAIKPILISEMYLIAAECGDASALEAIQTARGAEVTDYSAEAVQKEWYRETVGEGFRLSCMKRWNIGFSGRTPQEACSANSILMTGEFFEQKVLPAGDYHYVWPIPSYEIKINKNLKQNDGWAD